MAFTSTMDVTNGVAKITLVGELDAASAGVFRDQINDAATQGIMKLVLLMADLNYMASAGLRALVFAKQKMGSASDIFVIAAQESVQETLELTGFAGSVISLPAYDAAQIEG